MEVNIKKTIVLITLVFIVSCNLNEKDSCGAQVPVDYQSVSDYQLLFEDDFSSSQLDRNVWNFDTDTEGNNQGWGNGELQTYTDLPANAYIQCGALVIEAIHKDGRYTSARLHTHGTKSFSYGRIEARIRISGNDAGIWPAFWMLGENFNGWGHNTYGGTTPWPQSGEIDIFEYSGKYNKIIHALHFANDEGTHEYISHDSTVINSVTDYHTYSIVWDKTKITYYIDEKYSFETNILDEKFDEFRQPFFILLNLAIGGNLGGAPTPKNYPQRMYVDWVRVYQRK